MERRSSSHQAKLSAVLAVRIRPVSRPEFGKPERSLSRDRFSVTISSLLIPANAMKLSARVVKRPRADE